MFRRPILSMLFVLFLLPEAAFGAVRISEIAWMGNADSSANEWIELLNDGAESSALSGWILDAADGSPSIPLSGSIPAGGYFLIERTDDDSVSGISADLIASFGNGLSNTGETLRLKDSGGTVLDEVIGGDGWVDVGGDNMTKATAQRTSSGWTTALATPRAGSSNTPQEDSSSQTSVSSTSSSPAATSQSGSGQAAKSLYPRENITAIASEDLRVYVGAPAPFVGDSKGLFDEAIPWATYHWNFGDGATGVGKTASHVYRNPGNYLAVLEVVAGDKRATDRLRVSVVRAEAVIISVATTSDGVILIKNVSSRELDVSSWTLGAASSTFFVFPQSSIILPSESLPLPIAETSIPVDTGLLELRYANGNIASSFVQEGGMRTVSSRTTEVHTKSSGGAVLGVAVESEINMEKISINESPIEDMKEQSAAVGAVSQGFFSPWTMLFVTLILLGIVTTLYIRSIRSVPLAEEYALIEEEEGE